MNLAKPLIGEGAFAKVKFAHNSDTGEGVAIKVMAKSTILKHKIVEQAPTPLEAFLLSRFDLRIEEPAMELGANAYADKRYGRRRDCK
nr:CBL-interacting serine/threonine-protein kinase 24 isoform X1 [Ipomoea batatas]GMD86507.1 CBL-interacting serine/threonine-protein kinase 24 isoform X1 [Ipomoea batatas]